MARIRTIKPGFFLNEDVGALRYEWRLLFIGLWTNADRMGILEDRPSRLKAMLFPYDDLNVNEGLGCLTNAGLITRYDGNGTKLIYIPSWDRHQLVNRDEPPSEFARPNGQVDALGRAPNETRRLRIYERDNFTCAYCSRDMRNDTRARCVDHVVPVCRGGSHDDSNLVTCCKKCNAAKGSKTPEECGMTTPDGFRHTVNGGLTVAIPPPDKEREGKGTDQGMEGNGTNALRARFERFWNAYPRRVGKDAAMSVWLKRKPDDALTARIIAAVETQAQSPQWRRDDGRFIPHPRTWLSQGRWQDDAAVKAVVVAPRVLSEAEQATNEKIRQRKAREWEEESAEMRQRLKP